MILSAALRPVSPPPQQGPSSESDGTSSERRSTFLSYVHSLRGLAILMVVAVHVTDASDWGTSRSLFERTLKALFSNATVPFVFVSGFLFQHLSRRFRYRPYLEKRLLTVVLPYLIVSIPALVNQYLKHAGIYEGSGAANPILVAARACLTGAQMPVPLWYVPMIALFFLAAPLLLAIERRGWLPQVIVPALILAMTIHRSRSQRLVWQSALFFLPTYLCGMWASRHREPLLAFIAQHRWFLLGLAGVLFAIEVGPLHQVGALYSQHPFSTERGILDLDSTVKLLLTFLSLDVLKRHDGLVHGWFSGLAEASFGLFFLHEYVILLGLAIIRRQSSGPFHFGFVGFVVAVTAVVAISMAGVRITQRLLGSRSRFVIGC